MIRGFLQRTLGQYLVPLEIVIVLGGLWYVYEHVKHVGYEEAMKEVNDQRESDARVHKSELATALAQRDAAQASYDQYRADHPVGDVRLCLPSKPRSVPAAGTTPAGTGAPGGVAPEVHGGDSGVRERREGPDLGVLLEAYAAVFAGKNRDLRQQQQVK